MRRTVECRFGDPCIELYIATQIEAIGDVIRISQDFRLRGEQLAPAPLLLQFRRERVGILHALDVTARARIAVPVPGSAYTAAGLEYPRGDAKRAQPVQHIHAGET